MIQRAGVALRFKFHCKKGLKLIAATGEEIHFSDQTLQIETNYGVILKILDVFLLNNSKCC